MLCLFLGGSHCHSMWLCQCTKVSEATDSKGKPQSLLHHYAEARTCSCVVRNPGAGMPPCREGGRCPTCSALLWHHPSWNQRTQLSGCSPTSDENGFLRLTAASKTESHPVIPDWTCLPFCSALIQEHQSFWKILQSVSTGLPEYCLY